MVTSEQMLKELEVISRPIFKSLFTAERVKELFALLDNYALVVSPMQRVAICKYPKDNFLLEVALEGRVDYLVTGDDDLLVLDSFRDTRILRPADFRKVLLRGS